MVESSVTIANIKALGANGDANSKNEFSNELHFNGAPRVIPPDATVLPESVTATVGAVAVGQDGRGNGDRDAEQRVGPLRVRHRKRRVRHRR